MSKKIITEKEIEDEAGEFIPTTDEVVVKEFTLEMFLNKQNVDNCDIYPKFYKFAKKHVTEKTQQFSMEQTRDAKTKKIKQKFFINNKAYN